MRLNLNLKQQARPAGKQCMGTSRHSRENSSLSRRVLLHLMQWLCNPAMNHTIVNDVLSALNGHSIKDFMVFFLSDSVYLDCASRIEFLAEWPVILDTFANDPMLCGTTVEFSAGLFTRLLTAEITELVNKHNGWHFSARNACAEQIEVFDIKDMALRLEIQAPLLWSLIGHLLSSDMSHNK